MRVCVASSFFSPLLFLNHLFFFFFCIVILTLSIFTIDVIRQNFMKTDKQALFSFVFFFFLLALIRCALLLMGESRRRL